MRHGSGVPIIVGAATAGVPGNERRSSAGDPLSRESSPPVPLSRWERGNEGRAPGLVRLLGPAERHHAVPPGGEVLRGNLDVRSARARVSAARSDRIRSVLDLTPSATLAAGYSRQRLSSASFPSSFGAFPDQNVWDAGVNASWDLDVFGGIRHTVQARGALADVAQEDLRDVQVRLTAEVARAYFELRGAQEQLLVAQRNAENQRRTFDLTKQRLDAGRGSAFDTERAQAQLSSTLASIPAREAQVAAAQYRIGTLVGRSPTEVARELEQTAALPQLPEVASIGTPDVVVRYRPDVAAAERFAAAQGALVGAAKASYLPRISIGGTAGYAAPEFSSVGNQGTLRYAVGP